MAEQVSRKRGGQIKDISGLRFGRLTVIAFLGMATEGSSWKCACDCGREFVTSGKNLRARTKSCGSCGYKQIRSAEANATHGMYRTKEFRAWMEAKGRCFNPRNHAYANYGGRGITMCSDWRDDFSMFFAHIGPRPDGHSLDRIDNNKGYEPGNVRWANRFTQSRNRRSTILITHAGVERTLTEWSKITGIPMHTLQRRYHLGRPIFEPN